MIQLRHRTQKILYHPFNNSSYSDSLVDTKVEEEDITFDIGAIAIEPRELHEELVSNLVSLTDSLESLINFMPSIYTHL